MGNFTTKVQIYKASDGVRWRITRKGRIVAESGEAYSRALFARRAVQGLIDSFIAEDFETLDETLPPVEFDVSDVPSSKKASKKRKR